MRYVNKGPLFVDVHMHKPTVASRSFMDALLAFWPGLQVLKGDIKSAIEFHETLNLVIQVSFANCCSTAVVSFQVLSEFSGSINDVCLLLFFI